MIAFPNFLIEVVIVGKDMQQLGQAPTDIFRSPNPSQHHCGIFVEMSRGNIEIGDEITTSPNDEMLSTVYCLSVDSRDLL